MCLVLRWRQVLFNALARIVEILKFGVLLNAIVSIITLKSLANQLLFFLFWRFSKRSRSRDRKKQRLVLRWRHKIVTAVKARWFCHYRLIDLVDPQTR